MLHYIQQENKLYKCVKWFVLWSVYFTNAETDPNLHKYSFFSRFVSSTSHICSFSESFICKRKRKNICDFFPVNYLQKLSYLCVSCDHIALCICKIILCHCVCGLWTSQIYTQIILHVCNFYFPFADDATHIETIFCLNVLKPTLTLSKYKCILLLIIIIKKQQIIYVMKCFDDIL